VEEKKISRLLTEFFSLAFISCLLVSWYTIIVKKDFVVFTDETTVPASSDFFATVLGIEAGEDSSEE
jgi:hypothetical protein